MGLPKKYEAKLGLGSRAVRQNRFWFAGQLIEVILADFDWLTGIVFCAGGRLTAPCPGRHEGGATAAYPPSRASHPGLGHGGRPVENQQARHLVLCGERLWLRKP